jgi:hypothetical protein
MIMLTTCSMFFCLTFVFATLISPKPPVLAVN